MKYINELKFWLAILLCLYLVADRNKKLNELEKQEIQYAKTVYSIKQHYKKEFDDLLFKKCEEEEMPAGGEMKLEFDGDKNNIIELPPEWGIDNIHLLDG